MNCIETQTSVSNTTLSEYVNKNVFATSPDCPVTQPEFNWLFKQREHNGFASAFVKVSARSFLVHIPSFISCLNAKRGA
jgi:hypothetical protein